MQDPSTIYNTENGDYKEEYKKKLKYSHITTRYYAIFRIGKKFKSLDQLGAFQKHMQREFEVPNANPNIPNEILIGNENIRDMAELYTNGIKFRKNQVVARELLLTATHGFFNMPEGDIKKWKELNVKWLKDNFGNNCIYCVGHQDELTYHLHALIIPRFVNLKGKVILSNTRYFDGIDKLRAWQDNYASSMKKVFKSLNRGVRYSKAKHIEIRHFYAMINSKINDNDLQQVCARSTQAELLEIKLKSLEKTMQMYKKFYKKSDIEKQKLLKENKELSKIIIDLKKNNELNKEVIESLSELYKIPENAVKNVIKYVEKNITNQSESEKDK